VKRAAVALALILSVNAPFAALAQHGGGRPSGGGGGRSAGGGGGARPAAPAAPAARPAGGGFNFSGDTAARPAAPAARPQPARPAQPQPARPAQPQPARPAQPGRPQPAPNPGGGRPGGNNGARPPAPGGRPSGGRPPVAIRPPSYRPGPSWGWNHGVAWQPATNYWGGGFWGSLALAAASAAIYGSIVADNNQTYASYQVQPDSPGAILLQNYQLQQVPCGPPDLVVIYGPDNSVICAAPNTIVAPGYYNLDPTTLTIVSQ
jgi:hypothetical protein